MDVYQVGFVGATGWKSTFTTGNRRFCRHAFESGISKSRNRHSFDEIAGYKPHAFYLTTNDEIERLSGMRVTANFFPLLKVAPARGRNFDEAEEKTRGNPVAIIGHDLWQSAFGGKEDTLNRQIILDGKAHTIIGILPENFRFPLLAQQVQIWTTVTGEGSNLPERGAQVLRAVGRLKPNATLKQAGNDLATVAANLAHEYPATNENSTAYVVRSRKGHRKSEFACAGKEPRELKIDAKIERTKRITDLTDYNEVARLEIQEQSDARLWRHRYLEMDDVFIWKMPRFDLTKTGVDDMLGKFRKRKALILDLRGNSGGYEETQLRLLGSFFENDVKVGDLITRKETKPMIAKSIGKDAFKGQVIVLIDSDSASSSELLARVIQLEKRGTVIGDRSVAAVMRARHYSHTVGVETVTFYGVNVTNADLTMKDGSRLESAGVTPDEFLIPSQSDLAAGRDPVMARALALAGVNVSSEKATLFPVEWKK